MSRTAIEIGALYKGRWQIELLFRWIKQHLKFRKFLGNNPNAIKLQIYAAMIAYALLRLAARTYKVTHTILRFTDLVRACLFDRREIAAIERAPAPHPNRKIDKSSPDQMSFCYV
jgi:putative transposase